MSDRQRNNVGASRATKRANQTQPIGLNVQVLAPMIGIKKVVNV